LGSAVSQRLRLRKTVRHYGDQPTPIHGCDGLGFRPKFKGTHCTPCMQLRDGVRLGPGAKCHQDTCHSVGNGAGANSRHAVGRSAGCTAPCSPKTVCLRQLTAPCVRQNARFGDCTKLAPWVLACYVESSHFNCVNACSAAQPQDCVLQTRHYRTPVRTIGSKM
jgi:hypothetical protein